MCDHYWFLLFHDDFRSLITECLQILFEFNILMVYLGLISISHVNFCYHCSSRVRFCLNTWCTVSFLTLVSVFLAIIA